jgi:hypothetical protein
VRSRDVATSLGATASGREDIEAILSPWLLCWLGQAAPCPW